MSGRITLRNVSPELGRRLAALSKAKKASINSVVLEILDQAVGIDRRRERLSRYATWTEAQRIEFDGILAEQRRVDEAAWK